MRVENNLRHIFLVPAMLVACIASPCRAAATCPASIPAAAVQVHALPGQWTAFTPRPLALSGAGFLQGPPATLSDLKPYSTIEAKTTLTLSWKFEGPYREGIWLSCDYAGGVVSLAKRIPDQTRGCSVAYTKHGKSYALADIRCH